MGICWKTSPPRKSKLASLVVYVWLGSPGRGYSFPQKLGKNMSGLETSAGASIIICLHFGIIVHLRAKTNLISTLLLGYWSCLDACTGEDEDITFCYKCGSRNYGVSAMEAIVHSIIRLINLKSRSLIIFIAGQRKYQQKVNIT